jgi:hypothetical protein
MMLVAVVAVVLVLAVAEAMVKHMEARVRKQQRELALLRISATRMDMGGGAVRY